jgi:YggT family protein
MFSFIGNFLSILLNILYFAILARVLLSWFSVGPGNPFFTVIRVVFAITDPILLPIKRMLPRTGMFDFSPVVALILIYFIRVFIARLF